MLLIKSNLFSGSSGAWMHSLMQTSQAGPMDELHDAWESLGRMCQGRTHEKAKDRRRSSAVAGRSGPRSGDGIDYL